MKSPSMTVFGLHPNSKNVAKFYIPHYAAVPNIYPNTNTVVLPVDSVMYTYKAWNNVDFWNTDADILYAEDSLSFVEALNTSGNHYAYFEPFLKLYRVAHSNVFLDNLGKNKNTHHVLDILNNFLRADLIWISPIMEDRLKPVLKQHYSKNTISIIQEKCVVLPYPNFYKSVSDISNELRIISKKPLVFLWNHRLVENKNFTDFCWILSKFKQDYPNIFFKILFVCAEPEESIKKALPKDLHENMDYKGFISDKIQYKKTVKEANITLATSKLESFGNAVFDSISNGLLLINQDCNDALVSLIGGKYTYPKKDIPDIIAKAYKSSSFRNDIHKYNIEGMLSIPTAKQHCKILSGRISELLENKFKTAPSLVKSKIVSSGLKTLEKKTLTKQELYKAVGWSLGKTPINAHWAGYYYALRREGIDTTYVNSVLYFHFKNNFNRKVEQSNKAGLFKL